MLHLPDCIELEPVVAFRMGAAGGRRYYIKHIVIFNFLYNFYEIQTDLRPLLILLGLMMVYTY